jgi:large subunit ribosomal protein L5
VLYLLMWYIDFLSSIFVSLIYPMSFFVEYKKQIQPMLKDQLKLTNIHQVPVLDKVIVAIGIWSTVTRKGIKDFAEYEKALSIITGQKPHLVLSRKNISNFKLRSGMPVMMKATLRWSKAYDFMYRLIHTVLPRVRDYNGTSGKSFDHGANLSIGLNTTSVFPELDGVDFSLPIGFQITMVPSTSDKALAKAMFESMGMIFA